MSTDFVSENQRNLFQKVVGELTRLGYRGELLQQSYHFDDWFTQDSQRRVAPAVAFGQTPVAYDSACFGVIHANGKVGPALISDYRALGAPRAFEIREDRIIHWKVSASPRSEDEQTVIFPDQVSQVFRDHGSRWKPSSVLEAKNVAATSKRQIDFVDVGLIPALEQHVKAKLGALLQSVITDAIALHRSRHGKSPDADELIRLVFRALAGKVMHDRGVAGFENFVVTPDAVPLLQLVADHYNDQLPVLEDSKTQEMVVRRLWESFSFRNLSVEVLAYIWEDTLVTEELRLRYGIHATPPAVARYMVHRLPFAQTPILDRRVVEPCCGSGVFLVAALQRLRELFPTQKDQAIRHRYFQKMLRGYDVEGFGLEVARSCLMLADFPNPNGWKLRREDVFLKTGRQHGLRSALRNARIVLCNPPFENFTPAERDQYDPETLQKPVELLNIVLDELHKEGALGFVLPAAILDGNSYAKVRRRLAERFAQIDVVRLPDTVFERAEFPCALLIASQPASKPKHRVTVNYSVVKDADHFLRTAEVGRTERISSTPATIERRIGGTELAEIWNFLSGNPTVRTAVSKISRGVEWNGFRKEVHISATPKRGYVPGFHTANDLYSFQPPTLAFLWDRREARRGGAWGLPWHEPKVILNAVRKSRQPWRLAACPYTLNAMASQNFTIAWPREPWTANTLSAVLNGPVASAFVNDHENWKHNKVRTLAAIPLPVLTTEDCEALEEAVMEYRKAAALVSDLGEQAGLFGGFTFEPRLKELLGIIDTIVLRGYHLEEGLQRLLFAYFGHHSRLTPFRSDIRDLAKAIDQLPAHPRPEADVDQNDWNLFERMLDEDRERSLFGWPK
jgi:hypothetical protein